MKGILADYEQLKREVQADGYVDYVSDFQNTVDLVLREITQNSNEILKLSAESQVKYQLLKEECKKYDKLTEFSMLHARGGPLYDQYPMWRLEEIIVSLYTPSFSQNIREAGLFDLRRKLKESLQNIDVRKSKALKTRLLSTFMELKAEISGKPIASAVADVKAVPPASVPAAQTESVLVAKIDKLQAQVEALTAQVALLTSKLGVASEAKVPAPVAAGASRLTTFSPQPSAQPAPQPSAAPAPAAVAKKPH